MARLLRFAPLIALLALVGCRTCEDRPLFPRFRDSLDRDERPSERFRDRNSYGMAPPAIQPAITAAPNCDCAPGVGMVSGGPIYGPGNATPVSYPSGPLMGAPILQPGYGSPSYPLGEGSPLPGNGGTIRPRRDDELPLPGSYGQPGSVETKRTVPAPFGSFPGK